MDQARLTALLRGGETATVDFKLECNAFQGSQAATAELVKDIVALANNGYRVSYLLIGVGNDGRSFKAPSNPKLTEDAVQSLVATSIAPVPRVRLETVNVRVGKQSRPLVLVRVGPNKRRAYAFARDFINHSERLAFRRHEVWIRRGTTSDMASPQEVAALERGQDIQAQDLTSATGHVYGRMRFADRPPAVLNDLASSDPRISVSTEHQLALIEVAGRRMVLRVLYSERIPSETRLHMVVQRAWGYEHGLLVVTPGAVPKRYCARVTILTPGVILDSKESFGIYAQVPLPGSDPDERYDMGLLDETFNKATRNGPPLVIPTFILSGFKTTAQIVKKGRALADSLDDDRLAAQVLCQVQAIEVALQNIAAEGRLVRDRARPPDEVVGSRGRRIVLDERPRPATKVDPYRVKRVEAEVYKDAARSILVLSTAGRSTLEPPLRIVGEQLVGLGLDRNERELLLGEVVRNDPEGYRVLSDMFSSSEG